MKKFHLTFGGLAVVVVGILFYFIYLSAMDRIADGAFVAVKTTTPPMTVTQVENILGHPTRIEHSETTGITGDVYYYPYHDKDMKVIFVNNVVFTAEVVPGAKSS